MRHLVIHCVLWSGLVGLAGCQNARPTFVESNSRHHAHPLATRTEDRVGQQERIIAPRRATRLENATVVANSTDTTATESNPSPSEIVTVAAEVDVPAVPESLNEPQSFDVFPLDLSAALASVGGQHPIVGIAQWRTQEAYARLDQAEVLWLPSIQTGFSFNRHDGNLQNSNGTIIDANRSSFQYGLGAGAVGAGTSPRPGVVAQFHLADALFQPDIAERNAWARGHAANSVLNQQLLTVALAYQELLSATQEQRILEESRERVLALSKLTGDYAAAGQGLQADADRLLTEVRLVEGRLLGARERTVVASTRLAQQISLQSRQRIVPADELTLPLEFANNQLDESTLIATGLSNRPELQESQALVAAAFSEFKRQQYAPFVPSVLLGFSTGGFGGRVGSRIGSVDDRYDLDAVMTWEIRNLGFGEAAARRETSARIEQARFEQIRMLDQVAREVSEAYAQVQFRRERILVSESAIAAARNSYDRNLTRIRDGQGLPLEVLQSIRALEESQREYLKAITEFNQAQFQLQWAQGWPIN